MEKPPFHRQRIQGRAVSPGDKLPATNHYAGMEDDYLRDIFSGLGPITIRRLFGGKGIYHDGLIVGIVLRGELLLKADEASAPDFESAGAERWTYQGKKGLVRMPYWHVPPSAFDDPDEMTMWTRKAHEAALRTDK